MSGPSRTSTHVIDTLAVREAIHSLPSDFLVRGLEERDYGIDLQLEVFKGESATGRIAHVQVKGTQEEVGLSLNNFPTKTVEYAELFDAPFFVFYVGLKKPRVRFLWLQRFAERELALSTPGWRKQGSVTLTFPEMNILTPATTKLREILERHSRDRPALKFVSHASRLKTCYDAALASKKLIQSDLATQARMHIDALRKLSPSLEIVVGAQGVPMLDHVDGVISMVEGGARLDDNEVSMADDQLDELDVVQKMLLHSDEVDDFLWQSGQGQGPSW